MLVAGLRYQDIRGKTQVCNSSVFEPFLAEFEVQQASVGFSHVAFLSQDRVYLQGKVGSWTTAVPFAIKFEVSPAPTIVEVRSG
jgi:hypothetical protein